MSTSVPPRDDAPHPADAERAAVATYVPPKSVTKTNETSAAMLAARARGEVEARIIQAINFPRDVDRFRDRMLKACESFAFADAAMYEKPVGNGKTAVGFSIRFTEEALRNYGNVDVSVVLISEDDERRVIEGVSVDLETNHIERSQMVIPKYIERLNTREGDEVISSRRNSRGVMTYKIRATDDALFMLHRNIESKARRECSLLQLPFWIKEECEQRIEQTLAGLGGDAERFVKRLLADFANLGVKPEQIEGVLGKSLVSLTAKELLALRRRYNAIQNGELTWADVVAKSETASAGKSAPSKGTEELRAAVGDKKKSGPKPSEAKPEPSAPSQASSTAAAETDEQIRRDDMELLRMEGQ